MRVNDISMGYCCRSIIVTEMTTVGMGQTSHCTATRSATPTRWPVRMDAASWPSGGAMARMTVAITQMRMTAVSNKLHSELHRDSNSQNENFSSSDSLSVDQRFLPH